MFCCSVPSHLPCVLGKNSLQVVPYFPSVSFLSCIHVISYHDFCCLCICFFFCICWIIFGILQCAIGPVFLERVPCRLFLTFPLCRSTDHSWKNTTDKRALFSSWLSLFFASLHWNHAFCILLLKLTYLMDVSLGWPNSQTILFGILHYFET